MMALLLGGLAILCFVGILICVFILAEMAMNRSQKSEILDSIVISKRLLRKYIGIKYIRLHRKLFS